MFIYTINLPNNKKKACILPSITPLQVLIMPLQSTQQLQISTNAEKSNVEESGFWWLENFITTVLFPSLNTLKLTFIINIILLINVWAVDHKLKLVEVVFI